MHGGRTPRSLQARARETLADEARFLGEPLDVAPAEALLACVRVAAGELAYWRKRAGRIENGEELGAEALTLARLTAESLDRVGRLARAALDSRATAAVGADAEVVGDLVAEALESAFRGLDLTPEQRAGAVDRAVARLTELEHHSSTS